MAALKKEHSGRRQQTDCDGVMAVGVAEGERVRINTPLENHYSVYCVTSLQEEDTEQGLRMLSVYMCVGVCVYVFVRVRWSWGVLGRLTENKRQVGRMGD